MKRPRRANRTAAAWIWLLTTAVLVSCGGPGPAAGNSSRAGGAGGASAETAAAVDEQEGGGEGAPSRRAGGGDLDTLRSLPYVGFSDPRQADTPSGVAAWDQARAFRGYTLVTSRLLCMTELMDMTGAVVNTWKQPCGFWANTALLPNGELLVVGADVPEGAERRSRTAQAAPAEGAPAEGAPRKRRQRQTEGLDYLLRLGWDNTVIWKRSLPVHHDIAVLADGRLLTMIARSRPFPELDEGYQANDDEIAILSSEGELIESTSLFDLLTGAPDRYRLRTGPPPFWEGWFGSAIPFRFQVVAAGRQDAGNADLFHTNTVRPVSEAGAGHSDPLHEPGNVLVTMRHQDLVAIINLPRKEVVWAWGPGNVLGPHDASWLANGNILLLDNGLGRDWSRAIEIDPRTDEIVWEYVGDPVENFFTATRGACQRLPNGNTLITESDPGHIFEITSDMSLVWDFWTPHRNERGQLATMTRAVRVPEDSIAPLLAASSRAAP